MKITAHTFPLWTECEGEYITIIIIGSISREQINRNARILYCFWPHQPASTLIARNGSKNIFVDHIYVARWCGCIKLSCKLRNIQTTQTQCVFNEWILQIIYYLKRISALCNSSNGRCTNNKLLKKRNYNNFCKNFHGPLWIGRYEVLIYVLVLIHPDERKKALEETCKKWLRNLHVGCALFLSLLPSIHKKRPACFTQLPTFSIIAKKMCIFSDSPFGTVTTLLHYSPFFLYFYFNSLFSLSHIFCLQL